ncbi:unnamed protein product [Moneuplotes crassus]|uniref:Uncharacterized protein n=1 Tax=Euplotes crassus TaxID=5936 RepID=A0AAD1XH82_EUPCR|nr:unnamed protein product [Moneuplotes crassus]
MGSHSCCTLREPPKLVTSTRESDNRKERKSIRESYRERKVQEEERDRNYEIEDEMEDYGCIKFRINPLCYYFVIKEVAKSFDINKDQENEEELVFKGSNKIESDNILIKRVDTTLCISVELISNDDFREPFIKWKLIIENACRQASKNYTEDYCLPWWTVIGSDKLLNAEYSLKLELIHMTDTEIFVNKTSNLYIIDEKEYIYSKQSKPEKTVTLKLKSDDPIEDIAIDREDPADTITLKRSFVKLSSVKHLLKALKFA